MKYGALPFDLRHLVMWQRKEEEKKECNDFSKSLCAKEMLENLLNSVCTEMLILGARISTIIESN